MRRRMMHGKIHRARVTDADLNYVGSISIDPIVMKAADIVPDEQVSVYNLNNGARLETYAIEGSDGQICLNGAAARLAEVGDLVIIVTYVDLDEAEIASHQTSVVVVDEDNRPLDPDLRDPTVLPDDGLTVSLLPFGELDVRGTLLEDLGERGPKGVHVRACPHGRHHRRHPACRCAAGRRLRATGGRSAETRDRPATA